MKKLVTVLLVGLMAVSGCQYFNPTAEQIEAVGNLALTAAQIAAMYRQGDGTRRVCLAVGVYSDSVYGYCDGADLDAKRDAEMFSRVGFDKVTTLLNGEATRANIVLAGTALCSGLSSNDLFVITLSSHGGEVQDYSGDEITGFDQFFCAADGPLLDDDIYTLLCAIPPCRILFKVDTCHGGSMYRAPHNYARAAGDKVRNVGRDTDKFKGSMIYIGGCGDDAVSYGNKFSGGQLSETFIRGVGRSSSYDHLLDYIKASMPADQIPIIAKVGGPDFGYMELFE